MTDLKLNSFCFDRSSLIFASFSLFNVSSSLIFYFNF